MGKNFHSESYLVNTKRWIKIYYIDSDHEDIILSLAIAVMLLAFLGLQMLLGGFGFIGLRGSPIPVLLFNSVYYLFLVLCIPIVIKRFTIDMLGVLLFFFVSISISYIFSPGNQPYIEAYSEDIITIFPGFFIARAIRNPNIFLDYLNKTAYVLFLFGTLFFVFHLVINSSSQTEGYNMVFGYQLCIGILILLNKLIKEKKLHDLIFSLFGIIMIMLKGSRGPIMCIVVFLLLKFLYSRFEIDKKIRYLFSATFICALVSIYQENILVLVTNILNKFHIYSRTLTYMLNNNINDLSGRDSISTVIIEKIKLNPFGYGVFSDRAFLPGHPYAHNIVLEMLLDFGWVLGSLLLGGIALLIYSGLKNKSWTDLTIIFASYVMTELMFSGSYLLLSYFWIMLGVILNATVQRNGDAFLSPNYDVYNSYISR